MFTELSADNFKSWQTLTPIRLSPVTGFFGTNSSGKTSLLQILLLLKQTAESTDRTQPLQLGDERTLVDLGSFSDLIFDHAVDASLNLGVRWNTPSPLRVLDAATPNEILFEATDVQFKTSISRRSLRRPEVNYFEYRADEDTVRMERSKSGNRKTPDYDLEATINGKDYLRRTPGRVWRLPPPVKCYGFPDEASAYYQNSGFVGDLELEFDRQFKERLFYLGPLRSSPSRQYQWKDTHPEDVGNAGNRAIEALLASRDMGRRNARSFDARGYAKRRITVEQHVAEWLQELGLVEDFQVERLAPEADIYRVRVRQTSSSPPVLLTDVGFGVSQILPVLVLLAYVPVGSTVILEQPEIHLHPAVQSALADVILETAKVRHVQVIVESHSEHLLRRLQRRVAEGTALPEDLALYFCSVDDGASTINPLTLNLLGEIGNWPKRFFGDPLGETAAITRAALLRQPGVGS